MIESVQFKKVLSNYQGSKRNTLKRVFLGSDLRCSHKGLGAVAKKAGVSVDELKPGEYYIFVNNAKTQFKMVTTYGTTLAHFKMPNSQVIDLRAVKYLPTFFSGNQINYLGALKEVLT